MAMHLVGKIVPKDFQTQFRETPADFGLYGVIADYLEERGDKVKDALCFRAAAGRRWHAFPGDPQKGDWSWYAILPFTPTGTSFPDSRYWLLPDDVVMRNCWLPLSVQETLLDGWRGSMAGGYETRRRGFCWCTYRSQYQAQAALLTALRPVDNRRLNEWARVRR